MQLEEACRKYVGGALEVVEEARGRAFRGLEKSFKELRERIEKEAGVVATKVF